MIQLRWWVQWCEVKNLFPENHPHFNTSQSITMYPRTSSGQFPTIDWRDNSKGFGNCKLVGTHRSPEEIQESSTSLEVGKRATLHYRRNLSDDIRSQVDSSLEILTSVPQLLFLCLKSLNCTMLYYPVC
ncbi:hypothetical protein J6590_079541 [Homalodisca vitripennis]|nr:hypothetical protein J6590_079541 [Homalodisca vitripennis]